MELKKATEGLENFITTDAVINTLGNGDLPCYGVPPTPPVNM